MTLFEVYKSLEKAMESDIVTFQQRSYEMVRSFRENTTIPEELDKLDIVESQVGIRVKQVRDLGRQVAANIESMALGLFSPDMSAYLVEEEKKKDAWNSLMDDDRLDSKLVMIHLHEHKVYRKAIEKIAEYTSLRIIQDNAVPLRIVWETLHNKPRLGGQ